MTPEAATALRVPVLVVTAEAEHGVAEYARRLALAVDGRIGLDRAVSPDLLLDPEPPARAHLHFTDRLWSSTPEDAATLFERFASGTALTVTLHDLPQNSDGSRNRERRADCYSRVVAAAHGVVVNSHHELALLEDIVGPMARSRVIPLPVEWLPNLENRPTHDGSVAILGFFYPGKGHGEVLSAVERLVSGTGERHDVVALGRASNGHQAELDELISLAARRNITFRSTGYLDDAELLERCRTAAVPVAAHRHVSASGSIATWIATGRRPLVPDSRYSREMAALRPGSVTLFNPERLDEAIAAALADPASTWLDADSVTAPGLDDVAGEYLGWWEELHS